MPLTRRQRESGPVEPTTRKILGVINRQCNDTISSPSKGKRGSLPDKFIPTVSKKKRLTSQIENSPNNSSNGCELQIVCRDAEISAISSEISDCISRSRSGSMYISGAPGTGKTAVVRHVCSKCLPSSCRSFYVNCMRVDEPAALAEAIIHELCGSGEKVVSKDGTLESVERHLSKQAPNRPIVLVLDEMDALAHKYQETLYRLFDWPGVLPCRLILLCIANSLDLTDRLLPRLKARTWRPILLNFRPYSHDQLARIVDSRLGVGSSVSGDGGPGVASPIDPMAVQLCARKVAASSGDARAALDICRRSLDLASASPSSPAGLGDVSRALRAGNADLTSSSAGLPLQQKLGLAAALLLDRREFTLGALHDRYGVVCRKRQLPLLDAAEFAGVCQLLEARGLLVIRRAKETRLHKLSLKLDERSVRRTIDDPALIASVLAGKD